MYCYLIVCCDIEQKYLQRWESTVIYTETSVHSNRKEKLLGIALILTTESVRTLADGVVASDVNGSDGVIDDVSYLTVVIIVTLLLI